MRTIAIINQKGGCGKTTSAINLSAVFAKRGFRTLLVDMDPQGHCAVGLGIPEKSIERDVTDVLLTPDSRPLDADRVVWRVARGLDLVPSRMRLAGLEASRGGLASLPDKEHRLARAIARLNETKSPDPELAGETRKGRYDVCLIDCPPSIGLLTFNALAAAREILIPVETSYFSLQGATKQVSTVRSIARRLGVRIRTHVIPTIHDPSLPLAKDLLRELKDRFGSTVIPSVIRADPVLKAAASFGRAVIDHAPDSPSAEDYTSLCEWLIEHADIEREDLAEPEEQIEDERRPVEVLAPEPRVIVQTPREVATLTTPPADAGEGLVRPNSRLEELARRARAMRGQTMPAPVRTPEVVVPEPVVPASARAGAVIVEPNPGGRTFPSAPAARRVTTLPAVRGVKLATLKDAGPGIAVPSAPTQANPAQTNPAQSPATPAAATQTAVAEPTTGLRARLGRPVVLELVETEPVEILESVRRLFGCRATSSGALFVQPMSIGRRVCIAGEFNWWSPERAPMRPNEGLGVHELRVELAPGTYRYRIVVDGRWCTDEHNPDRMRNEFGEADNVVRVGPRSA
ncbi:MAG: hypothetical protein DHS20C14_09340 [Phycisphaeraceae bacterium]|nr:MAG: hypothetical protein DHS20C14_09340 [Phycisphaeraceae bacterium]